MLSWNSVEITEKISNLSNISGRFSSPGHNFSVVWTEILFNFEFQLFMSDFYQDCVRFLYSPCDLMATEAFCSLDRNGSHLGLLTSVK